MRKFSSVAVYFVLAISAIACGSSSPTTPTPVAPTVPQVAGSYAGTITITYPEINRTLSCPATTSVTQSGSSVNIAPLALSGLCAGLSIPFGGDAIDATGNFTSSPTGTYSDPSCGSYSYVSSGGFFGRELRLSMTAISSTCLDLNFSANLTR